jgi:hypothetical protein
MLSWHSEPAARPGWRLFRLLRRPLPIWTWPACLPVMQRRESAVGKPMSVCSQLGKVVLKQDSMQPELTHALRYGVSTCYQAFITVCATAINDHARCTAPTDFSGRAPPACTTPVHSAHLKVIMVVWVDLQNSNRAKTICCAPFRSAQQQQQQQLHPHDSVPWNPGLAGRTARNGMTRTDPMKAQPRRPRQPHESPSSQDFSVASPLKFLFQQGCGLMTTAMTNVTGEALARLAVQF